MKVFRYLVMPPLIAVFIFLASTYIIYQLVRLAPDAPLLTESPGLGSYTEWLLGGSTTRGALNGDFGVSLRTGQPVIDVFQERLPASLELFNAALLGSLVLGIPLGILMAYARRWLTDGFLRPFAWLGASMPIFWVGMVLILIFAIQSRTFPASGRCGGGAYDCPDLIEHLILPVATLLIAWVPAVALYVRGVLLRAFDKPGGASTGRRLLDGVLLPVLGILPVFFAGIVSSLVLVETIFAWPGAARLAFDAMMSRDMPLLTATVFIPTIRIIIAFLVLGLISGVIALLLGEPDKEVQPQTEAPIEPSSPPESVGLYTEVPSQPAASPRVWIDRLYTLLAIVAAVILVGITIISFSPSTVTSFEPMDTNPRDRLLAPDAENHPYGTDSLGRDLQARLLHGGQTTLSIAFRASLIALVIGGIVGFVGGLFMNSVGVILNIPIQIVVMALNFLPFLLIVALAVNIFTPEPGNIAVLMALFGWGSSVLAVRAKVAQFFDPKGKPQSLASWLLLPIYLLLANMPFFILAETSLSFLGVGVQPPTPSWGLLLSDARNYMAQAEHLVIIPGLFITLTIFCFYLVSSRLRDHFQYS